MPWGIPESTPCFTHDPAPNGTIKPYVHQVPRYEGSRDAPPPCNGATRPQCMYEESLWMIDKRVFLRRQPDHNRNLACTLTRDILKVAHCRLLTPGVGGHVGYWRLFGDNAGYLPRYPGGLHHPEEVVTPRIGKSNQPLAGGSVEGLWGIRCTI